MKHDFPHLDLLLKGETLKIEYKQDLDTHNKLGPYSADAIAESIMALSNQQGGHLLLGVDNNGKITGINKERKSVATQLGNQVARKFVRDPLLQIKEIDDPRGKVIIFYVPPSSPPPHQLLSGVFKIRKDRGLKQGAESIAFPLSELAQ